MRFWGGVSQKDSWAQRRAVPALPGIRQGGRSRLMERRAEGGRLWARVWVHVLSAPRVKSHWK